MNSIDRTRTHISTVVHKTINAVWTTIVFIVAMFLSVFSNEYEDDIPMEFNIQFSLILVLILIAVILLAVGTILLIAFLQWRNTYFSADESGITVEKGVMYKRKLVMPFEKINTVDIGINIFQRIIGTCTLKINSGAASETGEVDNADMKLYFKLEDGQRIRDFILARNIENNHDEAKVCDEDNNCGEAFKAGFGDFFLYGLTQSKLVNLLVSVIGIFSFIIGITGADYFISAAENLHIERYVMYLSIFKIICFLIIGWFVLYIISTVFSVAVSFIHYFNFTVRRTKDSIAIEYGLINLKKYTLPVRNIHAVITSQSFLQQLLGLCSVTAVSVGYGNEKNETALLFPLVKMKKLNEILGEYLPEYTIEDNYVPRVKKALPWKIATSVIRWVILGLAVCIPVTMIFGSSYLYSFWMFALLVPIGVFKGIMRYKNSRIGYSEKTINVMRGCLSRSITHIKMESIQSVTTHGSVIYRKYGLADYTVDYFSAEVDTSGLSEEHLEKIAEIVEKSEI